MAHCPPALLDDVRPVIAEALTWAGVVQKTPGVLYVGRQPWLHFHLLQGQRRCADVRERTGWTRIELPRPSSVASRRRLLRALRATCRKHRDAKSPKGRRFV
jgi:hypothetical protein